VPIAKKIIGDTNAKTKCNPNLIELALEGGKMIKRRDRNMYTAFTYGKKLRPSELEDLNFVNRLMHERGQSKLSH